MVEPEVVVSGEEDRLAVGRPAVTLERGAPGPSRLSFPPGSALCRFGRLFLDARRDLRRLGLLGKRQAFRRDDGLLHPRLRVFDDELRDCLFPGSLAQGEAEAVSAGKPGETYGTAS